MRSREVPVSLSQCKMASNPNSPSLLDPIHRWLRHVDEQISPGESVEFLKLPLYPFLRVEYAVAERLKTPSEIHNFLLKKCFQNDKEKTLYWFAHGLRLLGGDLRGSYLAGDNCVQGYGLSLPTAPDQSQMTEELQFFECLTKIAKKARGLDLEEGLKYRFSKKSFLNVNPRHLKHLPDLFIRLVQNDIIAPRKTYHLKRALSKVGKAEQCLICLNKYHKSVGLDEIEEVRDSKEDPQTEAYRNTDQSSDTGHGAAYVRPIYTSSRYGYHQFQDRKDHRSKDFDESLRALGQVSPTGSEGPSVSASDSGFSSQAMDTSNSPVPTSTTGPDSCTHCRKAILCCCWVLALVITLALAGSLCGTVWRHVFHMQTSDDIFVYNKSAVIVTELNQYYDHQLRLFPKMGYRLEESVIEIYRFDTSCDRLPTKHDNIHWHKSNINGDQNYTHQYLLPGSTIRYTISPVDRDSVRVVDMDEPLESDAGLGPIGYAYITYGPESEEFNSMKCNRSPDCTIISDKTFKKGAYFDNSYAVEKRGYYNFHSVIVDPQYKYNLDLAINAASVIVTPAQQICNISDIDEERECTVDLEFKIGKVCIVAYTEYEGGILHFEVKEHLLNVLLTSALPTAALFLFILFGIPVVYIIYTVIKVCRRKRNNQYVPVNVQA